MFLIYPQVCLYCEQKLLKKSHFCEVCQSHFTLLDPAQYCPFCFSESEGVCSECVENKRFGMKVAAACDHLGAVATHIGMVRRGMQVKMAASLLSIQFFRLRWEVPDLVVPIPSRGSLDFVKNFSRSIGVSCSFVLKNNRHVLPQMRLPWKERRKLSEERFYAKANVEGKTVLLVDDLFGTGATLRAAAQALEGARRIYALTISRLLFL